MKPYSADSLNMEAVTRQGYRIDTRGALICVYFQTYTVIGRFITWREVSRALAIHYRVNHPPTVISDIDRAAMQMVKLTGMTFDAARGMITAMTVAKS